MVNRWLRAVAVLAPISVTTLLAGCGAKQSADPLDWWHNMEGGRIAQQRPPPPGAHDPYPNLADVPPRPTVPDAATRHRITNDLTQQRDSTAERLAEMPLTSSTALKAVGETRPAAAGPSGQPPDSHSPASGASGGVGVAPAAPPSQEQAALAMPEDLPPLADKPPPPPNLPGAPALLPAPKPVVQSHQPGIPVAFSPGSDVVPVSALPALRELAGRRGGQPMLITGYGEAMDGTDQPQAMLLALRRARAVATALHAAGVPDTAFRLAAEAKGMGARVRFLH